MAYIAFPDLGGMAAPPFDRSTAPTADAIPPVANRLTPLEWSVVSIARGDRLATLRRPGRRAIMVGMLIGRRNPMLADTRLEALRRIAVLTWHNGYTVPPREVRAFLDAGFTPGQYEAMVDRIGAVKVIPPRSVGLRDRPGPTQASPQSVACQPRS